MTNVLALGKYGPLGASTRLRLIQYEPWLRNAGIDVTFRALLSDKMLRYRYLSGSYSKSSLVRAYFQRLRVLLDRRRFDVLWIDKEALPWLPLWVEQRLLRDVPYVLDYDDAIFHNYDRHSNLIVRSIYGRRVDELMANARVVVAGNDYLADRATKAGCGHIEYMPTVVDLDRYLLPDQTKAEHSKIVIGWIGSPSTAKYLSDVSDSLEELRAHHSIRCVAIGAQEDDLVGTPFESVQWQEDTEVATLHGLDIGIMPLLDTPWERGKCGYKLIQYMACGLPVVASPVGVNIDIVGEGENGYLANDASEWLDKLELLTTNAQLRERMGAAGRRRVEQTYCLQVQGPRMARMLIDAATQ